MMRSKKVFGLLLFAGLCVGMWCWFKERTQVTPPAALPPSVVIADEPVIHDEPVVEAVKPEGKPSLPKKALIAEVPFTVQAPNGEWANPIFQDACEEASLIMAEAWVRGAVLTKTESKVSIEALAAYQKKRFGHSVDTSLSDTASILTDYFHVATGLVERDVTVTDIKEALAAQKIVIVPTDGRKLKNPNFTQPGPARHMLVLIGYDDEAGEFVTNDPGTRKGEGYRYDEGVLFDAILDYVTGKHAPVTSADKAMLTVSRVQAQSLQK